MLLQTLAVLGLSASSCLAQAPYPYRRRQAGYPGNSTTPAAYNPTSSSSSSSSIAPTSYDTTSSSSVVSPSSATIYDTTTSSSVYSSSTAAAVYNATSSSSVVSSTIEATGYETPSNSSTIIPPSSASSPPPYTSQPYHYNPSPVGPGTASSYNTSAIILPTGGSAPQKVLPTASCTGQTLNVLGASLDWWYARTVYNVVSTISLQFNTNDTRTGWTVIPATTTFDLDSALASPTCTGYATWNTVYNMSFWDYECTPAPTPVAASTTAILQTAFQLNATTGTGFPPNAIRTPAPAAITIPQSGGTYSAGTAFVFFSKYEIMTKSFARYGNGSYGCAAVTQTYDMAEPFSFEYTDGDVNGSSLVGAGVTGDVNPAFLGIVNATKAKAGSWVAAPTVAVVVQNIVAEIAVLAVARPGFAPKLTTETVLQTPSATLPVFSTPPLPTNQLSPTPGFTGRVESTNTKLQVPTTPNPPPPKQTPGKPAPTTPNPAPTQKPNPPNSPQNTPTPGQPAGQPTGQPGQPTGQPPKTTKKGGIGHAVSVIFSAIRPTTTTNALSILESAEKTFHHTTNPTVAAILNGVHGHQSGNPGSGSPTPAPIGKGQQNGVGTGPAGKPVVVVDGTTFTGDSQTHFSLGPGETLTPGGVVDMHGTHISLSPALTAVVINDHTYPAASAQITTPPSLTVGGKVFAPIGGPTYNIAGHTLTPGGVIVVSGTTISLSPAATAVVIDGKTHAISPTTAVAPILTFDGTTFAPNAGGTYLIDGHPLTPGGVIVVDGTTLSLSPAATALVVNGITSTLPASAPTLTIGPETFTGANGKPTYSIDGHTLTPGAVETVTINGKVYIVSLSPNASVLKIETEGPGGKVTATMFETLTAGGAGAGTKTRTAMVGASASAAASASASVTPALANAAGSVEMHVAGLVVGLGAGVLAVWL